MRADRLRCLLLPALLLCVPVSSFAAQTPGAAAQSSTTQTDRFASEPYIIQSLASITTMKADGTGTRLQTISLKIQSEAALRQFGVVSLFFASQSGGVDFVYARVVRADGTVVQTPSADAMEQPAPVTREAPFYSDIKSKELPIKSLRVGDTLQWQARFTVTHPEVPGQFWGQDSFITDAVVLDEVHELHVPTGLHVTAWTNPHDHATFLETTEENEHVYRWRHADLEPTVGPAAEAKKLADETRLLTADEELDATKGKLPSLAWTTFPDWAAVGAWYRTLSAERALPDSAVKAKVAELTAGKTTDLAKAQAIYTYVSSQVRYIGVAFGVGRYQPHAAAEVLSSQYGDCKDKHTLLAGMLNAAGLHADPVLIGSGIRFNAAVPSPASFNHLITHMQLDGQPVWLDSTTELAPWRALAAPIRDEEALLIPATAPAVIMHTPADLPYPAIATSTVTGSLDKDLTSDNEIKLVFRNDDELVLRSVLRNVSPSNYGVFMQQFMQGMGFGGTTSQPAFEHLDDSTQPLVLSFHYHRVKDKDWGDNRITATFAPIALPSFTPQKPPTSTILLGTPRTETSTVEVTLPPGWGAEVPEALHAHAAFATCDVTYRLAGGKLYEERKLVVLKSKVPVGDYKAYQAWYDEAGASGTPFVQLTPPGASASSPTQGATPPSNPKAAELVRKAGESIRTMDPDSARALLDQAKGINASERGLWMGYAAIEGQMGKSKEAVEDLRHELALFPDEVQIYRYLVMQQMSTGDREGANATIHDWIKARPDDPNAEGSLLQLLEQQQKYAELLAEAQSALTRFAGSTADLSGIKLAEAQAQLKLGRNKEAAATAEPLLEAATDPNQINSIAYLLSEAGEDLPQAEAAQRHALALIDTQTEQASLAAGPILANRKQNLLAAAWDTMGWILHREGKDEAALTYISPALRMADHPAMREHLTTVAAALHSPSARALASQNSQQMRSLPLGPAKGRHGTAGLRMLVADGHVLALGPPGANPNATPTGGELQLPATVAGADDLIRKADLHALFAPESKAHLVLDAFINCHDAVCELIVAPISFRPL